MGKRTRPPSYEILSLISLIEYADSRNCWVTRHGCRSN